MSIKKFSEFASDNLDLSSSAFKLAGYRAGTPNTNIVVPSSRLILNTDYEVYSTSATVTIDAKNKKHIVIIHTYGGGLTDLNIINATPGQELLIIIVNGGGTADIGINSLVTDNAVIWPASPQIEAPAVASVNAYALRVFFPPLSVCEGTFTWTGANDFLLATSGLVTVEEVTWSGGTQWAQDVDDLMMQEFYFLLDTSTSELWVDEPDVTPTLTPNVQTASKNGFEIMDWPAYDQLGWEYDPISDTFSDAGGQRHVGSLNVQGPSESPDWLWQIRAPQFTLPAGVTTPLTCGDDYLVPNCEIHHRPSGGSWAIVGSATLRVRQVNTSDLPLWVGV